MKELVTDINIRARASHVWEILMDFDAYPSWNPFITKISGRPKTGSRLEVRIEPPGGRPATFSPKVLVTRPNREFRWKGRLLIPRIFDGEHCFIIEPVNKGTVHFIQRERFSGILVPFIWNMLATRTRKGFLAMNKALKSRAEKSKG